jgi:hypothetical protein
MLCDLRHFKLHILLSRLTYWDNVRVRVTLRLAVYRQSVRLGAKPLEDHDQIFSTERLRSYSLNNILSDEKMGCLL